MAVDITKEDGTGLAGATTYQDEAGAATYMEQTGRLATWESYGTEDRAGGLVAATQYMDTRYRSRYLGEIQESTIDTQALLWPREEVPSPRTGLDLAAAPIPDEVQNACAEFALALLKDGSGNLFGADQAGTPVVTEKAVRVEGAVSKSEKFASGGKAPRNRRYPAAEAVLSVFLQPVARGLLRA